MAWRAAVACFWACASDSEVAKFVGVGLAVFAGACAALVATLAVTFFAFEVGADVAGCAWTWPITPNIAPNITPNIAAAGMSSRAPRMKPRRETPPLWGKAEERAIDFIEIRMR